MPFDILQDIREILHGLGERKPRWDAVNEIQSVLLKQMALLIYQAHQKALTERCSQITIKHLVHVLRGCRITLIRMLSYYLLKDNVAKLTSMNETESTVDSSVLKLGKSIQEEFVDSVVNKNDGLSYRDPLSFLKSLNFKSTKIKIQRKKKTLFWHLYTAITELRLDLKIDQEDINNAIVDRQIRVDNLAIILSNDAYESFQFCRKKNFQHRLGKLLLAEVNHSLPENITYGKEVKEFFMFLAKETIACLYDRVCNNRKINDPDPLNNAKHLNFKKKVNTRMRVDEITAVVNAVWKPSLGDICVPYEEDNKFFSNSLIFD